MPELKPCPFCGCDEIDTSTVYDNGLNIGCYLYCTQCQIEQGVCYANEKEAKEAWNRRVKDDNL